MRGVGGPLDERVPFTRCIAGWRSRDDPRGMPSRSTVRSSLALIIALVAAFLSMWIFVPAPTRALLTLGVGAPEVSAWLVLLAILGFAVALIDIRQRTLARVAAGVAAVATIVALTPLLRFRAAANESEHALRMALGGSYLDQLPEAQRARIRPSPLVFVDLFRGLGKVTGPIRIARHVPFAVEGGDTLTMDVYRPDTPGMHPVLVQIYGGAWQRGEPGDYAAFAQDMAALGYAVFAVDYRHAPASKFPAQINDVRRALAWIGANADVWHADTSRLALMGRSAGAHLAMLAAYAADAPRVRGVIDYYGPVDLVEGYRRPPAPDPLDVRDIDEKFLGGTPDQVPALYHAASPISLVTRRLPPTLLIYGGRDHVVEPRFGTLLAGRLLAEGTTVVHIEIPWAEHAFDAVPNGPSGQLARYVTERFLGWVMTHDASR